jgi:hypothetical protein
MRKMLSIHIRCAGFLAAPILVLGLTGCTEVGARAGLGEEAADPSARTDRARYSSVLAGFTAFRPVEPTDWRRSNERVAPSAPPAR